MTITTEEEEKVVTKPKKKEVKKEVKPKVPLGYIPVKLDSLGKLSASFELHFRDYSIEEVLELASTSDDTDNLEAIIKVLNNMVFEDFDCGDLTHEELMEVLYTIQGSFYSNEIERKIIIDETKPNNEDNYTYVSIPLGSIDTKTLSEEFKEPFTLTDSKTNKKIAFRLPRVKDKVTAEAYLRDRFKLESRKFSKIHSKITKIESIRSVEQRKLEMEALEETNSQELEEFKSYLIEKAKLLMTLIQALSIISVDDEIIEYGDFDKLLEILPTISRRVWETYTNITEKYKFGLVNDVTFYLPEAQKEVTRRLAFRPVDFLPNNDKKGDTGITVSFG